MKLHARAGLACFLVGAVALPAMAFIYPLSRESITEAYSIGSHNDERTGEFFAQYTHHLQPLKTGAYVSDISVETPFAQIADRSKSAVNYHVQEAEEEFMDKPLDLQVHVWIYPTATYAPIPVMGSGVLSVSVPDFWNDFKIRMVQKKEIRAISSRGGLIYSQSDAGSYPIGAKVDLVFDATKIDSDDATIEVVMPDGQMVETTFNLAKLR